MNPRLTIPRRRSRATSTRSTKSSARSDGRTCHRGRRGGAVWEYLDQVHREAFHRCTYLGSTAPHGLIVIQSNWFVKLRREHSRGPLCFIHDGVWVASSLSPIATRSTSTVTGVPWSSIRGSARSCSGNCPAQVNAPASRPFPTVISNLFNLWSRDPATAVRGFLDYYQFVNGCFLGAVGGGADFGQYHPQLVDVHLG